MKAWATNLAAEPKPGQWSVTRRSLSMVLGQWKQARGWPACCAISSMMWVVSAVSLPPM